MPRLTHTELLDALDYNPLTGVFIWLKATARKIQVGDIAGGRHSRGYLTITINNETFYAHVLAWFYIHSSWPNGLIDHDDRNRLNNSISNLRPCNNSLNAGNSTVHKDNLSGLKGVSKMRTRFRARIQNRALGTFGTAREAAEAYDTAALSVFGQFATTNKALGLI